MRLLQLEEDGEFSLLEVFGRNIPRYAILSHTWGADNEEVTYRDLVEGTAKGKAGYCKLTFCAKRAAHDGLQFFWVDTCCIDKSSSSELTEAINSMFRWYEDAERCYVYLPDVSVNGSDDEFPRRWKPTFKKSRWFTRGWTLQELLAPTSVEFFSEEEQRLGDKQSLEQTLHEITGIAVQALRNKPLHHFSVDERMLWAKHRETKREEDEVYSLLGIFNIHMPLLYGEGREKASLRLRKEIEELSKGRLISPEEKRQKLLDSLMFEQIDARQMTVKDVHTKTCTWLLQKSEYLDWLDATKMDKHHGFLWIKGKPGTGKSTLLKFALSNVRNTMTDRIVISFFFNARGEGLEKSTVGAYQSLLLQLLQQVPTLQEVFDAVNLPSSTIGSYHQWSVGSLQTLLKRAIKRLGQSSVVCFIDALDECDESQIRDMLSFFEQVGELALSAGSKFYICFSSRHYPHITFTKGLHLVLEGQEGHNQDIITYVDSELEIGYGKEAEAIRRVLCERASGIFMWVILVVRILNKEYDSGRIALHRRLQEIPNDLHELFRDLLTRDSDNRDELVLCIQWVLFSERPLSPEQLYLAIFSGVESETLPCVPDEVTRDAIKRFITNSSKGLVEITTSDVQKVQFIHESVKDYLLKENGLEKIWPDFKSNLEGQSHDRLKHCCLNYMSANVSLYLNSHTSPAQDALQEIGTHRQPACIGQTSIEDSYWLDDLARECTDWEITASDTFCFLKYAVRNVLYHADMAEGSGIAQAKFLQNFPLANWIKLNNTLESHDLYWYTPNASLLYILAQNNMANLIKAHPLILLYLEEEDERYGSPLLAALAAGSQKSVITFVEAHARNLGLESCLRDSCNKYCQRGGRLSKFDREFVFSKGRSVLSYLAELGDEVLVALALEIGNFAPDCQDTEGRTPLCYAAINGHEAIVRVLLATDRVDVNSNDRHRQTPLLWAAENNHESVVQLLLATGKVDLNRKDTYYGRTPLSWAAERGQCAIVEQLLSTDNVDADLKDWYRQTPLLLAAGKGHRNVVKLLLATGKTDVDSKDMYGRTPLSWAVERGHKGVVKLLLEAKDR